MDVRAPHRADLRRFLGPGTTVRVLVAVLALAAGLIVALQLDGSGRPGSAPLGSIALGSATPAAAAVSTPAPPSDSSPATPSGSSDSSPDASPAASNAAESRARTERAIRAIVAAHPAGSVSLAAVDLATGTRFAAGATSGMWTASVYKLLALETLLLQHQRAGTALSGQERSDAAAAIEHSRNKAGYRLFLDAGGDTGLAAGVRALGMRHTVLGSTDPTFTRTSAGEGLRLLDALTGAGPLDAASRRYVLGLMQHVEADQRWGVGAVADPGSEFVNKNGWLSVDDSNPAGETDDGRWIVDSLGIVTVHGHRLLMAVLTEHNGDFDSGVRLVQRLARLLARAAG